MFANVSLAAPTDTREASQLFSYVKQAAESGALDLDERAEDVTGGCHDEFQCDDVVTCKMSWHLIWFSFQPVCFTFPSFLRLEK